MFVNKQYDITKCFRMLISFKCKRLEISLLLRETFKWTICLSSTTKRSQVTRYGPCLTLLNQPKAHSFQESSRMKRLAPSPTPGYWDCVLREQISAGCRSWDKGEAGDGNPDAEIRGVPGLQFLVFVLFCFVFLSPSRLNLVMGCWFGLEIRRGAGPQRPSSGSATANN